MSAEYIPRPQSHAEMQKEVWDLSVKVFDAMEKARKYTPVYEAVLKNTGDKKQALDAILYIERMGGL